MNIDNLETGLLLSMVEIEERILRDLARQLIDIAGPPTTHDQNEDPLVAIVGIDSNATKPTDPIQARLFPDAYPEDPDASLEFRRFTERSFRQEKSDRVERILAQIEAGPFDGEERQVFVAGDSWNDWVAFLNDLRISLGTKLNIDPSGHPAGHSAGQSQDNGLYDLYNWLTWMQESLIERGYFGVDLDEDE